MKHGLMMLYQYIEMIMRLHIQGMGYGHIDFTNLFMGINSKNPQAFKISDDGEEIESFSRDLVFMDPNLCSIFTKEGHK